MATAAAGVDESNDGRDGGDSILIAAADGMVAFDVDAIKEYVICGLCHGVYREPYTTIKCLHTFCKSCLMIALHASHFKNFNMCPAVRFLAPFFGLSNLVINPACCHQQQPNIKPKLFRRDVMNILEDIQTYPRLHSPIVRFRYANTAAIRSARNTVY
jgi:Zinc finger, C3HC4 type (RING finger)